MFFLVASLLFADIQIINGVAYECKDGMCMPVETSRMEEIGELAEVEYDEDEIVPARMKMGYMEADEFLSFLEGREEPDGGAFAGKSILAIVLLALLGGLLMNLTPCVLPMIPINLMIIGKSFRRGLAYGAGIALAYGALGVLAAAGGMAFGQIQSSPWFNFAVAAVFIALSLSLFGVFFIDFSKRRVKTSSAFLMGALSAVLAGACVAPVLISVLIWTAKLFAGGSLSALALPFAFGLGMAFPWPLLGAGMQILPKPGAWMVKVNRLFGVLTLVFAAYYIYLGAIALWRPSMDGSVTPETFELPESRPVLVDCWATWCKNCTAMEKTTLRDAKVREALEKFTVIRLQAEDMEELRLLDGFEDVKGLPAFLIFE